MHKGEGVRPAPSVACVCVCVCVCVCSGGGTLRRLRHRGACSSQQLPHAAAAVVHGDPGSPAMHHDQGTCAWQARRRCEGVRERVSV